MRPGERVRAALGDGLRPALLVHSAVIPVYALWILVGFGSQFLWASILMQAFTWVVAPACFVH